MSVSASPQATRRRLSSTTLASSQAGNAVGHKWFDVPEQPFLEGTVTGIELVEEMLELLQAEPRDGSAWMEIQHTLAAIFSELYTGATSPHNRKGAAESAALTIVGLLAMASTSPAFIGYVRERASFAKEDAEAAREREEADRRAFVERMRAGRAAKQAQRQEEHPPEDFEQVRAGLEAAGFKLRRGEPPMEHSRFYVERWGRVRGFTRWAHVQTFLGIVGGKR